MAGAAAVQALADVKARPTGPTAAEDLQQEDDDQAADAEAATAERHATAAATAAASALIDDVGRR